MQIQSVLESRSVISYLEKRGLLNQYKKSKANIISGNNSRTYLKKREPKSDNIWYFRINRQFRAIGYLELGTLKVVMIDNHQ